MTGLATANAVDATISVRGRGFWSIFISLALHGGLLATFAVLRFHSDTLPTQRPREIVIDTIIAETEKTIEIPNLPDKVVETQTPAAAVTAAATPDAATAELSNSSSGNPTNIGSAVGNPFEGGGGSNSDRSTTGSNANGSRDLGKPSFFGLQSTGQRVVYVIDRSGSMETDDSLDIAKSELLASLETLPRGSRFQIIVYNESPKLLELGVRDLAIPRKDALRQVATQLNAIDPKGGTNHLDALRKAVLLKPEIVYWLTDADDLSPTLAASIIQLFAKHRGQQPTLQIVQFRPDTSTKSTLAVSISETTGGSTRAIDPKTWQAAAQRAN